MDRLVNEAIKESFTLNLCKVDLILKHLKNKENINWYIEDKFNKLVNYAIIPVVIFQIFMIFDCILVVQIEVITEKPIVISPVVKPP